MLYIMCSRHGKHVSNHVQGGDLSSDMIGDMEWLEGPSCRVYGSTSTSMLSR